jgi:hypothetical protein
MTMQEAIVETTISRAGRRIYENIGYAAFLLMAIVPVAVGLADGDLTKRVVDMQGPIAAAELAIGTFIGWMKTLGHRENMQQMKGP